MGSALNLKLFVKKDAKKKFRETWVHCLQKCDWTKTVPAHIADCSLAKATEACQKLGIKEDELLEIIVEEWRRL